MERAPLRQVPSRHPDPAEAVRYVIGELPGLDEPAASALALVVLVGRSRAEACQARDRNAAAGSPGHAPELSGEELADALTRARKALRRRAYPLPGSGWCERAERLISDRIDGALRSPGPALLDVHLANCPRCVEHERRLGQCHDALVAGFSKPAEPETEPGPAAQAPGTPVEALAAQPALRVVDPAATPAAPRPPMLPAAPQPPMIPAASEPPMLPAAPAPPTIPAASEPPPPAPIRPAVEQGTPLATGNTWASLRSIIAVLSVAMLVIALIRRARAGA